MGSVSLTINTLRKGNMDLMVVDFLSFFPTHTRGERISGKKIIQNVRFRLWLNQEMKSPRKLE
uniref:Uncharacterized protein n=1 Tax=Rhizophora mucronata TaxID=61149 RepID=A0A2P2Q385_RHIMU